MNIIRTSRRSLAIQINKEGELIIRAPLRMKESMIELFLKQKKDWIDKHQKRIQEKRKEVEKFSGTYLLFGERLSGEIEQKDLIRLYRKKLREYIDIRIPELIDGKNLPKITGIKITSAKTRWGSCSGKNSLNFSLFLGSYAPQVIDSVIIHEMTHLLEKNHGPRFWKLVYTWMPDYNRLHGYLTGKEMKDYE